MQWTNSYGVPCVPARCSGSDKAGTATNQAIAFILCAGFAHCMLHGIDLPVAVPLERWDLQHISASDEIIQSNMLRFGAFAGGIDRFDEAGFRLSKSEAVAMDPQTRVLLQQVAQAMADARPNLTGTADVSTGVYVGCVWQEYQLLLEHLNISPSVNVLTGSGMNFMIGRVSYTFGLQGKASLVVRRSLLALYFCCGC